MRIGTKLGVGTGTLLTLGLVIGTVSYVQNDSIHERLDEMASVREPVNSAANELKKGIFEATSATLGYLMTGDTTLRTSLGRTRGGFMAGRETTLALLNRGAEEPAAPDLMAKFTGFYTLADRQIALRDRQAALMDDLLTNLESVDVLLRDRIGAAVRVDDPIAFRRLQVALEMQVQMNAMMKELGKYLLTGDERFRGRIAGARRTFSHFLQVYQVVTLSEEEKTWAAELIRRSDRSLGLAALVTDLQKERLTQLTAFMEEYGRLGAVLDDPLLLNTTRGLADAKRELLEAGARANSTIMLVLLAGLVFGIGAAVVTTKGITTPLRHLISFMNAVEDGGSAGEIALRTSDEFRQVSASFNTMMRRLAASNDILRREVAERRRVEENLRESELRFRTIFEDAPIGIALASPEGEILQANEKLGEILGVDANGGLRGKSLDEYLRQGPRGRNGNSESPRQFHFGRADLQAEGKPSWISVNVSHIPAGEDEVQYSIVMMEDLTAQIGLEQQLAEAERERVINFRLFAHSVQKAQEEERSRIARELHDDICQRLTGLKYHVEVLEEDLRPKNRRVAKHLGEIREELDRSVTEVRRISSNLRPSVLDDFGLVTALRLLCREFQSAHGITASFRVDPGVPGRSDPESETAIYRITQQALANAARHSGATAIVLDLAIRDGALWLRIADNGRGIQLEGEGVGVQGKRFGLVSMRERAELLGGEMELHSGPEGGTSVSVTIPLKGVA